MKLLPGVRLNFGKRGIGISAGVPGARVGVDSRGKAYTSAGIPGTGLSVRSYAKRGTSATPQQVGAIVTAIFILVIAVLVIADMLR